MERKPKETRTEGGSVTVALPEDEYFTLVFKGSLRTFKGNPMTTETPFGIPFVCGIGNAFDEADELREVLEGLTRDDIEGWAP